MHCYASGTLDVRVWWFLVVMTQVNSGDITFTAGGIELLPSLTRKSDTGTDIDPT